MPARLKTRFIPVWKEAPFIRLLLPLVAGIILQWYLSLPFPVILSCTIIFLAALGLLFVTRLKTSYRAGIVVNLLLMLSGCWLVFIHNPEDAVIKINEKFKSAAAFTATIQEPLVSKAKTFKAIAYLKIVDSSGRLVACPGNIIVYFLKDSVTSSLSYGDVIAFTHTPAEITNNGNPGAFDYKRYAGFHGIYFHVFLQRKDYRKVGENGGNFFYKSLFIARTYVVETFKKYIHGKREAGLAEALLVGFKDDLDKDLVEQYATTGVVHIIAISGMHLGLIYGLLLVLFKPLQETKHGKWVGNVIIMLALWIFSFLTGAAPSITRSALMFTAILAGNSFERKMSIYNSLSVSAFILLLVNPFNIWDVGFQLSYAALLSIAILSKPITNLFRSGNFILQNAWQLIAVTLAAQAFTLPLVVYHFHQFPLSFILSNIVAVPLSSIILYALILLLCISWIQWPAVATGWFCFYAIKAMNNFIAWVASLSFSLVDNIHLTIVGAIFLFILISFFAAAFLNRSAVSFTIAAFFLLLFFVQKAILHIINSRQSKLIVYNVPHKTAIDIINGNKYYFLGDSSLQQKSFLQNFHLLPSRIGHQVMPGGFIHTSPLAFNEISSGSKKVLLLDKDFVPQVKGRVKADLVIISASCRRSALQILSSVSCANIVLDGTVTRRQINDWKNAADSLHLRLHSVQQQGAFVTGF